MVSGTKFRQNVLNILNKEKKHYGKYQKWAFRIEIIEVKYKDINHSRSLIPVHTGMHIISKTH